MKKIIILMIFLFAFTLHGNSQEPCGEDWLCGSAIARVDMPESYLDGVEISMTGGINMGTTYKYYMCCAASTSTNACYLGSQSNEALCFTGRTAGYFRNVRFR